MGWTAAQVRETSIAEFCIMRDAWKMLHMPEPEKPGMSRKDAMALKAEMEEAGYWQKK